MHMNWIGFVILFVSNKFIEVGIEILFTKFWKRLLSDENLNELLISLKLQIVILYLESLLKSNPINKLSDKDQDQESDSNLSK